MPVNQITIRNYFNDNAIHAAVDHVMQGKDVKVTDKKINLLVSGKEGVISKEMTRTSANKMQIFFRAIILFFKSFSPSFRERFEKALSRVNLEVKAGIVNSLEKAVAANADAVQAKVEVFQAHCRTIQATIDTKQTEIDEKECELLDANNQIDPVNTAFNELSNGKLEGLIKNLANIRNGEILDNKDIAELELTIKNATGFQKAKNTFFKTISSETSLKLESKEEKRIKELREGLKISQNNIDLHIKSINAELKPFGIQYQDESFQDLKTILNGIVVELVKGVQTLTTEIKELRQERLESQRQLKSATEL